jgi:hypothetical protein
MDVRADGSRMSMRRYVGLVVILATTSCETDDPLARLDGCLNAPGGPTLGKQTLDLRCDLQRDVRLIAVPYPVPDEDELLKLGLPRDGVLTVLQTARDPGAHWCTLDQFPVPPPVDWPKNRPLPTAYRYEVECVPSRVRIHTPAVVQSIRFALSLATNDTGEIYLAGLRAAP